MSPFPPLPLNEIQRLQRLHELMVLDSEPEPMFDAITRLASEFCGTSGAMLNLVDAGRQWSKGDRKVVSALRQSRRLPCGQGLHDLP